MVDVRHDDRDHLGRAVAGMRTAESRMISPIIDPPVALRAVITHGTQ